MGGNLAQGLAGGGGGGLNRNLHDLRFDPLARWQLQQDASSPRLLDATDSAGVGAAGIYDLTKVGITQVGAGHSPEFQAWINLTERLENTHQDLNLLGAMSFACLLNPSNAQTPAFITAFGDPGATEATNTTQQFTTQVDGFGNFHENGAGNGNPTSDAGGTRPGWQWIGFTRSADGLTYKNFVNDVKVLDETVGNAPTGGGSSKFVLGEFPDGGTPFVGAMASVVLYDKELTEAQMAELAGFTMGV
jgi:hypothetical protein